MSTVSTSPTLIVPKVQARVTFTPTTGNFLRAWIYDAPLGSTWRKRLDAVGAPDDVVAPTPESPPQSRIRLDLREVPGGWQWTFEPDRGGKYLLAVQEYVRGTNFGGSYADDPNAQRKEDAVGALELTSVSVASWVDLVIGSPPDRATLRLAVRDDRIVATSIDKHRFRTPAIESPQTARAAVAMTHASVQAALGALAGELATTVLGSLPTILSALIDRHNAHITESGVHATDDDAHRISTSYRSPSTVQAMEQALAEVHRQMFGHYNNQDVSGIAEGGYHSENYDPLLTSQGTVNAIAMLWHAHELHRVSEVHDSPDAVNSLAPLPPLLELIRLFVDACTQVPEPDAVPVSSSAATVLIHQAGFEERDRS